MPSLCFRAICIQMAKLHDAIIDFLPQEQVKVDNQLVEHVFDHLYFSLFKVMFVYILGYIFRYGGACLNFRLFTYIVEFV